MAREEKKINVCAEDKRRPILSRDEGIDFYPQWSTQQGVREGELRQEGRGYNRSQGGERIAGNRRGEEAQEQGGENKAEKMGRNTCLKGRIGDHVSSGKGRRLEEKVRRK